MRLFVNWDEHRIYSIESFYDEVFGSSDFNTFCEENWQAYFSSSDYKLDDDISFYQLQDYIDDDDFSELESELLDDYIQENFDIIDIKE